MKHTIWCQVFVAFLLVSNTFAAPETQIIPQPREISTGDILFGLSGTTSIVVSPQHPEDRSVAQMLAQELRNVAGLQTRVVASTAMKSSSQILLGRFTDSAVKTQLQSHQLTTDSIGDEGYILDVTPQRILVAGKDASGVFYGVQTLKQLIKPGKQGWEVPGVHVRDWPALAYRGTEVDLSRGPVLKLEQLKRIVRTIAEYKMNQLNVYIEDVFPLDGEPLVGLLDDKLSREDYKELVAYATPYHVDIVPITGGCGHLHKVLRFEQYAGIGEVPFGNDLAADNPAASSFLDRLYSQLQPVFPSKMYHVGCDTPNEVGTGATAKRVNNDGFGEVYLDNLLRAYHLVHRYNKQVIFWSDAVVAHPEVIPKLPKDVIPASMRVWPESSYAQWIKPLADSGLEFFVCPWVGNAHVIVPDYEAAAANIGDFISEGKRRGAIGTNIAVWNDDGEMFAPNWWSIVYGAANAWEQQKTDVQQFDQKYDWAFYRNTDHNIVRAIKELGHINELIREHGISFLYVSNYGGANNLLFWEDPFSTEALRDIEKLLPVSAEMRRSAEEAFTTLKKGEKSVPRNADTLKSLEFAALKLDALGFRYQAIADLSKRYAKALSIEHTNASEVDGELYRIQGVNGVLFDLRDYNTKLREMHKELWLEENLSGWLPNILQLYDRSSDLWQRRILQIEQIKRDYRQGTALPPMEELGLFSIQSTQGP